MKHRKGRSLIFKRQFSFKHFFGMPQIGAPRTVQARKCALPSCINLTVHNGGYCSAVHCLQHRAQLRAEAEAPKS